MIAFIRKHLGYIMDGASLFTPWSSSRASTYSLEQIYAELLAKRSRERAAATEPAYETEAEQAGAGESFGGTEETWSGPPHALSDLELRAMTALLEMQAVEQRHQVERQDGLRYDPWTDVRKAVMAELVRRGAFAAVDAQATGGKT